LLEDRSRNTVENAVFSKALARPRLGERWLLVTSGYHMPRSVGTFRKVGFPVEPYPVDWRTRGTADALRPFPTMGEGTAAQRHCHARMGRARSLLDHRAKLGAVPGSGALKKCHCQPRAAGGLPLFSVDRSLWQKCGRIVQKVCHCVLLQWYACRHAKLIRNRPPARGTGDIFRGSDLKGA
jgi:hypothetical protein